MHKPFEARGPEASLTRLEADRQAECIEHAHRYRELAETVRSHSIRQMLLERAAEEEDDGMMFSFADATD
jgi:rubrerythrin